MWCSCDHILDEIPVSRGVDDGDLELFSHELPEGNIDSDTKLTQFFSFFLFSLLPLFSIFNFFSQWSYSPLLPIFCNILTPVIEIRTFIEILGRRTRTNQKIYQKNNMKAKLETFLPRPLLTVAGENAFHTLSTQMLVAINRTIPEPLVKKQHDQT